MSPTPPVTKWAAEQCLGLANAVKRIHGLTTWHKKRRSSSGSESDEEQEWGRHGDIKPHNILWFSAHKDERDLLVLSDLGLTRYHSRHSKSFVPHSRIEGYTGVYRPPEMQMGHLISQKYDIWSLGCVYLEFCTWYLDGVEAIREFESLRLAQDESDIHNLMEDKYFNIITGPDHHKRPEVKQAVGEVRIR